MNDNDSAIDKILRDNSHPGSEDARVLTSRCCRAQLSVSCSPINVFLTLMNNCGWPQNGSTKVRCVVTVHGTVNIHMRSKVVGAVYQLINFSALVKYSIYT